MPRAFKKRSDLTVNLKPRKMNNTIITTKKTQGRGKKGLEIAKTSFVVPSISLPLGGRAD